MLAPRRAPAHEGRLALTADCNRTAILSRTIATSSVTPVTTTGKKVRGTHEGFNVGVEIGAVAVCGAVLAVIAVGWRVGQRLRLTRPARLWRLAPYAIGALASFWLVERVAAFCARHATGAERLDPTLETSDEVVAIQLASKPPASLDSVGRAS